ncbi:MAG: hypothetical protein LQ352_003823 [Teloschistes flavicans]|nr:MAG: hypothetical protein LQ352_003823 [Teloschistes flavicans]
MAEDIETSFNTSIERGKINGAVICVTDTIGHFIYDKALGTRTLLSGEKIPQRLDDILFLASATKLVTTIAAMQCVEQGLLTLTGDLSSITPELAAKQVIIGFSEDGETPLLEPAARPITLEMLLTHTSGTAYDFTNPRLIQWRQKFDPPGETSPRPVEEAFNYPLAFQPGSSWMYSVGLDWAGKVIERVTGRTLNQYVQQFICDPLGIKDAQFYPVTRQDWRSRLVDLNPQDPNACGRAVVGGSSDVNRRAKGDFGGHGLFMPAADYIKILHSLLANDGKMLKPATVDDMFQDHLGEASAGYRAALTSPLGPFFRVGIDAETKTVFGLGGVVTLEGVDGWYGQGTMTWGGGLSLAWFIDRKNDLCGICAVQPALPDIDVALLETLKQTFRRDIYRKYNAWKK